MSRAPLLALALSFLAACTGAADSGAPAGEDGTDGATDGADGTTDGTDGAADGTDGAADGTDGSADGSDGSTDGSDGTEEPDPWGRTERTGYSYNPLDYSWDGGETLILMNDDGTAENCRAEGSTGGNLLTTHDCADCTQAWEVSVYIYAGTGTSCADFGLDDTWQTTRTLGYAPSTSHDGGTLTDALLARDPSGTWRVIGQATTPGATYTVEYTLFPGQPAWEQPSR